jgi:hypothetical protein
MLAVIERNSATTRRHLPFSEEERAIALALVQRGSGRIVLHKTIKDLTGAMMGHTRCRNLIEWAKKELRRE